MSCRTDTADKTGSTNVGAAGVVPGREFDRLLPSRLAENLPAYHVRSTSKAKLGSVQFEVQSVECCRERFE